MTLVAGVDSSTQSCKVVIRDLADGHQVRAGRAPHPDGTAVDPEAWWRALSEAIVDAGGLADVSSISIAGQQHGMVALDADGVVIRDALLWNDTRSAEAAADLVTEYGAAELARRTGLVPVASFTISKLRWLADAEPANARRVAAVALPHDWLTWRLRGYGPRGSSPLGPDLDALVTDRSDASGTGYWNPETGGYDRDLLIAALGHDAIVPQVLPPDGRAGTVDRSWGSDAIIGPGAGDNAGAALGLGLASGDAVISLGTSGTVFASTSNLVRDESGTIAGFADAAGRYLPLIATLNAARVLDSMATVLGVDHDELGTLALKAPPGVGGAVLRPYFEGERTPNLPDATATIDGLTLANSTPSHFARLAVEGMLCGLADGLEALTSKGITVNRALLIGGAAQNVAVQTIAGQVFDVPIEVPQPGEYVAMGAAVQAAWVLDGARPAWSIEIAGTPAHNPQPEIRAQYARVCAEHISPQPA
jgi:xylulokinase